MKQVEEEYFKVQESGHSHPSSNPPGDQKNPLAHPTPAIEDLKQFLTKQKGNGSREVSRSSALASLRESAPEEASSDEEKGESPRAQETNTQQELSQRRYSTIYSSPSFHQIHASELSNRPTMSV